MQLRRKEYISLKVGNEFVKMMGQSVLHQHSAEIRSSWFSTLADEATDISHHEQISLYIHWVDNCFTINDDTLGPMQLPDIKALTMFWTVNDILVRCSLLLSQCQSQTFDSSSNMGGIRNGVQALHKEEAGQALYVHCLVHILNRCIRDVTKTCDMV